MSRSALRLLYVDPHPVPGTEPEALQIAQTADALASLGAEVTVLTSTPVKSLASLAFSDIIGRSAAPGLVFQQLPYEGVRRLAPRSNLLFNRAVTRWIARQPRFDAFFARNLKTAEALLNLRQAPLYFETHELFVQSLRDSGNATPTKLRALTAREARVYADARHVFALTAALRDDVRATYPGCAPLSVTPDGVDLALAKEMAALDPDTLCPALPAKAIRPVVLYLGSLHRWKGIETLLKAVQSCDEIDLWIAGGDAARITQLQHEFPLAAARTHFVGAVPPAQRFAWIAQADICVLPLTSQAIATRYTSPLKLFEYMALAKPIISADVASIREVLTDGDNARLVPPDDAASLSTALRELARDAPLRARLGAAAGLRAHAFTWRTRAQTILTTIGQAT